MTDVLSVNNLKVSFGLYDRELEVVRDVSFKLRAGSVLAVVGESGSGKSVTAQAIMGLLPANGRISGGEILFRDPAMPAAPPINLAGLPTDGIEIRSIRGARISKIFQEPMTSLSPVHTIGDQVQEALTIHRAADPEEAREETLKMLGLVGFPDPERAYASYAFELSGGLRQRAMIAMALMCRPAVLIADEPTTALDVTIQAQVLKLLKDLQSQIGMGILLITHDLGVVANMADDVAVLYRGELMEYGTADDLLRRPQHTYLKALMTAVPRFDMGDGERLTSLREVARRKPIGSAATVAPRAGHKPAPGPLLALEGVRKSYGGESRLLGGVKSKRLVAVDDVNLNIQRGECLGLVGESGCGKTTLSKIIMRAVSPDRGSIIFDPDGEATDIATLHGQKLKAFRPNIQMVFQDPVSSLSPRMTVLDVLREPLEIHRQGSRREQVDRAAELMEWVGLDPSFLSRYPHSFSGGQRQRIGIARALALSPRLLILDEPVSALDVSVQAQILNLLKDLKTELGLTFMFISHNLAVVDYMADNIAVMARGRIVEYATRHQLFRDPIHPYTRLLLKSVPYADRDRPMDFNLLGVRGATDEINWAPQFRSGEGRQLTHIDVGDGHIVLADPNCTPAELRQ